MKRIIVLIAHGTVEDLKDLPDFLLEIRRGRPAPPELIKELEERYRAVDGSPHLEETRAQGRAVEAATGIETRVAMRLWHPKISEVVSDLGADDEVVLVPLAPFSVSVYEAAARRELGENGPKLRCVAPWGSLDELLQAHQRAISAKLETLDLKATAVILTAHSLPTAVIRAGDTYGAEFQSAADAVGSELSADVLTAYQSQGASGGQWLGPTLLETMEKAKAMGKSGVLVAPIGFLSEHIETLYDLDIEAKQQAEDLGLVFNRVPTLSCDEGLIAAIGRAVSAVVAG